MSTLSKKTNFQELSRSFYIASGVFYKSENALQEFPEVVAPLGPGSSKLPCIGTLYCCLCPAK